MAARRLAINRSLTLALFTVAACALATPATAQTDAALYTLNVPSSSYTTGCQAPCLCPVVENPTYGSFNLVPAGSDTAYLYYQVQDYIASFNNGPGAVSIVGSGLYLIGRTRPIQSMTLYLQVWGGPVQRLDSGLVPDDAAFPRS